MVFWFLVFFFFEACGKRVLCMFCKICVCPGMVMEMSNFKLMNRTEKAIIK